MRRKRELDDLRELIGKVKDKIKGIVVGGIASSYQGERVKKICDEFGLEFVAPLLGYEPEMLWRELLDEGFEVIMIKICCDGIEKDWIGRVINETALDEFTGSCRRSFSLGWILRVGRRRVVF